MKSVDNLLTRGKAWLNADGGTGCLVSSRIRLARNINGSAFPGWAGEEEVLRLWRGLRRAIRDLSGMETSLAAGMEELDGVNREVLVERHLISREMAGKAAGSGVVIGKDETISIMVNEEDHLRIQAISPGLDLAGTWETVDRVDSELEDRVDYAVSPQLGYLSACPTNIGTGMRASVMMHLPGLSLMNEIKPVINGISKMGMAVRGLWGEGSDAAGDMFQVSNQVTLGESEATIVKRLERIVLEIAEHEKNARRRLMQKNEVLLHDYAGRAIGILLNARLLDSRETLSLLSHLRLAIDMGISSEWDGAVIDELFMLIQPGHLQKQTGKVAGTRERDLERSRLVREQLVRRRSNKGAT